MITTEVTPPRRKQAFSLVELSIVLVILGLLVGGILAGKSLIQASELRAVTAELMRYQTAYNSFRDKYFAIPGDMANAISFWGASNASPATCRATASTSGSTCNGNGNGIFDTLDGVTNSEAFNFWVQLTDAGLVEGNYTGTSMLPFPDINAVALGTNVPASRMKGAGYMPWYCNACWMGSFVSNLLVFGSPVTSSYTYGGILTGIDAQNIDTKLDDGKQLSGRVRASWDANSCTGNYVLTNDTKGCNLLWLMN